MNRFELITVSDRTFGTQIGTLYKQKIQDQISVQQQIHPDTYEVRLAAEPYMDVSRQYVDDLLSQLDDMARAAEVNRDRLISTFIPELEENNTWVHGKERCSTLVSFNENGDVVIGHNEDWDDGEPADSIGFLETPSSSGLWYKGEGLGSAISVNKYGIWQCANQVNILPCPDGVPRLFTAWKLTQSRLVSEAIRFIQNTPQASAFTYVFIQRGMATRVEHAGELTHVKQSVTTMVSTNHLIYPPLTSHQREIPVQSKIRYEIATERTHAGMMREDVIAVLSHPEISRPETLASVVATVSESQSQMRICYGRPGPESVYVPYPRAFIYEQL